MFFPQKILGNIDSNTPHHNFVLELTMATLQQIATTSASSDDDKETNPTIGSSSREATLPCPLLDELPPELRNTIYQLVFTSSNSTDTEDSTIDLTKPSAPSKALSMTCRRVYNEAAKVYKNAYRAYWTSNKFRLYRTDKIDYQEFKAILESLSEENLQHIAQLEIHHKYRRHISDAFELTFEFDLVDIRGIWKTSQGGDFGLYKNRGDTLSTFRGPSQLETWLCQPERRLSLKNQMHYLLSTNQEYQSARRSRMEYLD